MPPYSRIATGVAPATTAATSNDYSAGQGTGAVPGAAHQPDVSATTAPGPAIEFTGIAQATTVPTPNSVGCGTALLSYVDIEILATVDRQHALGMAAFAAYSAVAHAALAAPHIDGNGLHAGRYREGLHATGIVECLATCRTVIYAIADNAVFPLATTGPIGHRRMYTAALLIAGIIGANLIVITICGTTRLATTGTAHIPGCTGIVVTAIRLIVGEYTTVVRVARIIRATVSVIAGEGNSTTTDPFGAGGLYGASIFVVAHPRLIEGHASLCQVTETSRAFVAIVAKHHRPARALPSSASIIFGTYIAIVTGVLVGQMGATGLRFATIVGAIVAVIANQFARCYAGAQVAMVAGGADIPIIAGGSIEQVQTSLTRVAAISRTNIVIAAHLETGKGTNSPFAVVTLGAGIAIRTGSIVGGVDTRTSLITGIVGARIGIITVKFSAAHAHSIGAHIPHRAGVPIGASYVQQHMGTPHLQVAAIFRARVVIVAIEESGKTAASVTTKITCCAGVSIVTISLIWYRLTTGLVVTTIVGAEIAVITRQRHATDTLPCCALVLRGTRAAIVARSGIVHERASNLLVTAIIGAEVVVRT